MATENGNGEKREYIRLAGMYSRVKKNEETGQSSTMMLSNDISKQLDVDDSNIRLSVMNNDRKDFANPQAVDAHLLIERKHLDTLIDYLQMVGKSYDERMNQG